jgi:hypothetical protein
MDTEYPDLHHSVAKALSGMGAVYMYMQSSDVYTFVAPKGAK